METISTHNTPPALYDALVSQFGETIARKKSGVTRWVSIGCGGTTLNFFAPANDEEVRVTVSEPMTIEQRP